MPTDEAFVNRTGLKRVEGVGSEFGLLLGWFAGSGYGTPLQRQVRKKGPVGASPVAAPMPKSVSF